MFNIGGRRGGGGGVGVGVGETSSPSMDKSWSYEKQTANSY